MLVCNDCCPSLHKVAILSLHLFIDADWLNLFFFYVISELNCISENGGCKSIVQLNVIGTAMTKLGARLAIQHLPKLAVFKCHFSLEVIARMFEVSDGHNSLTQLPPNGSSTVRRLPLTSLYFQSSRGLSYVAGFLTTAVRFSPFIVHVEIMDVSRILDQDIRALLELQQLRHLLLESIDDLSFDCGLLPILRKFGSSSLEHLELVYIEEIDLAAIVEHCSNLRSLMLINNTCIQSSLQSWKLAHQNQLLSLQSLCIRHGFADQDEESKIGALSKTDLSGLLLSSPSLVSLKAVYLDAMTDQLIESAAVHHGFSKLKCVEFNGCKNLTRHAIDTLISLDSPIEEIAFSYNRNLTERDKNRWEKIVFKKNWNLSFCGM